MVHRIADGLQLLLSESLLFGLYLLLNNLSLLAFGDSYFDSFHFLFFQVGQGFFGLHSFVS